MMPPATMTAVLMLPLFGILAHSASVLFPRSNDSSTALVVAPSEYFEGNDGPWSSFFLRVGSPAQDVRVLVSTASPESMVVLADDGCSTAAFPAAPSDCAVSRGVLFNPNQSSSWQDLGLFGINQNGVGLEANLGYYERAEFALDTLGLDLTGPSVQNQTVAGIASPEPFYLGIMGVNPQPVNFTTLGNFSSQSLITSLKNQGYIPSLTWSYTAGAKYRLKQVYGQLIFSGYDTSRFTANSVSFTMAADITRDLVVFLQSISYSGTTSTTLLSDPVPIFIDSTDPNLWLPASACMAFEQAFGLTLDNATGLYLVSETQNAALLNASAQVTFTLSDVASGGDTVAITLPYDAFALTALPPLVDNSSYYFPLKQAANESQYTLGRVFLQEAYLSADYERNVFNVSACSWIEGAQSTIVTIPPLGANNSTSSSSSSSSQLSGGAIAGIAIGAVLAVLLLAAILIFLLRRRHQRQAYKPTEPEPDMSVLAGPVHNAVDSSSSPESLDPAVLAGASTSKFYSPDGVGDSIDGSNYGESSGEGGAGGRSSSSYRLNQDSTSSGAGGGRSSGSNAVAGDTARLEELDGESTQVSPVYHELPANQVSPRGAGPDRVKSVGPSPLRG